MQKLRERSTHVDRREDADDLSVLHDDCGTVFVLGHRCDDFVERCLGLHGVDDAGHGIFDSERVRIDVLQGLDEVQITIGQYSNELASREHGKMADPVLAHHVVRFRDRLIDADRVRARGHVFLDSRNGLAHGSIIKH